MENGGSSDEELITGLDMLHVFTDVENKDGKWMLDHPWKSKKPDPSKLKMKDTVTNSTSYPTSSDWTRKNGEVDLAKILLNLPIFVENEMKGSINGSRKELEELLDRCYRGLNPTPKNLSEVSPHVREIVEKIEDYRGLKLDRVSLYSDKKFKATSRQFTVICMKHNVFHFDCEFMLRMHVPDSLLLQGTLLTWFDIQQCESMQWIRKINYKSKEKRWIFIPSFRRAQIALVDWPEDDIVTPESTIRILVVRPSEFKEYVKYCGNYFPIICLPQDEIGAGYPRYWIQKIALRLKLQFIWMIDDSVECFYEYHPTCVPPLSPQDIMNEKGIVIRHFVPNYSDYRRRKFGLVFERIEDVVKEADDSENPIAAMSPRRWNPMYHGKQPFVCKPPQGVVYLNLRALLTKNVYYRPELKTLEDMIFAYECENKGLKVYMDNRVNLQDHVWKNSGASSPSVKGK